MSVFDIFKQLDAQKAQQPSGPVQYIVCGLGNPGTQYENTRHNAGFMAIDTIAEKIGADAKKLKFKSLTADVTLGGVRCLLMKPSTFMNNSGEAVAEAMNFYKLTPDKLLIIYDDISLDVGRLRIRQKGSDGGHNGLKNIQELLETQEYPRIRIGIGNDFQKGRQVDFVIGPMSAEEKEKMPEICDSVIDGVKAFVTIGIDRAMNCFNTAKK